MLCACRGSDYGQDTGREARDPPGGHFFFTPELCNEIVRALTQRHPEAIVDVVARAESIVRTGRSDGGDPCASFILARAYHYSGESKFMDHLEAVVRDGAKGGARGPYAQDVVWRAAQVFSDLYAFHLLDGSEDDTRQGLLRVVESQCGRLARTRKMASPLAIVMAAGAAAMTSLAFPKLRSANVWREWGLEKLSELISGYVRPPRPVSLGERCLVAEVYLSLILLSQIRGIEVPSHVLGGVEAVIDSIAQVPEVPAPDDGSGLVLNVPPFESSGSRKAILALGAVLFDRVELCTQGSDAAETLLWLTGSGGLEEYEIVRGGDFPSC